MELKIYDGGAKVMGHNWNEIISNYDAIKGTRIHIHHYGDTVSCNKTTLYKFKGADLNKALNLSLPNRDVYYCKVKDLNVYARKRKIENLLKTKKP